MAKDDFTKQWIIENSISICAGYDNGVLTLRGLHYQLVGLGMTNDIQHYKRVVSAMIDARWDGLIGFDKFSDLDRGMEGETEYKETDLDDSIEEAKSSIHNWMNYYRLNRWENQPIYPEVLIEKKALQGVFARICGRLDVGLGACKGYPSLTFLHEASERYRKAINAGKDVVILYFGDYDPSGEDIPRSIKENMKRFDVDIAIKHMGLTKEQVLDLNLPPAPAKLTDTRTAKWTGLGQVELDAVKPEMLINWCSSAISGLFDQDLYRELNEREKEEKKIYVYSLKEYINELSNE